MFRLLQFRVDKASDLREVAVVGVFGPRDLIVPAVYAHLVARLDAIDGIDALEEGVFGQRGRADVITVRAVTRVEHDA